MDENFVNYFFNTKALTMCFVVLKCRLTCAVQSWKYHADSRLLFKLSSTRDVFDVFPREKKFRLFIGYEEKVGWKLKESCYPELPRKRRCARSNKGMETTKTLSPVLNIDDWKAKIYKSLYIAYQSRKVVPDSSPAVVLNICSISPCKYYQILFYFSL